MKLTRHLIVLSLLLAQLSLNAYGSNTASEAFWADLLSAKYTNNEVLWLEGAGKKSISLINEVKTARIQGAAIILHSVTGHPDWPYVIAPLRNNLPKYGWLTLSIQLPLEDPHTIKKDYALLLDGSPARITAAINYLSNRGIQNIVLIGYGMGGVMAANYLDNKTTPGVTGFIGINITDYGNNDKRLYTPRSIKNIAVPMLDIYGSLADHHVLSSASARAYAAREASMNPSSPARVAALQQSAIAESALTKRTGFIAYRKIIIAGANQRFTHFDDNLLKRIAGWLKHHAGGVSRTISQK